LTRGFAQADVQAALDRLKEQGYLDDERFATAWARGRIRTKPMGSYRLSRELEARGVDEALVREVVRNVYEEGEEPLARRALTSKRTEFGRLPAASRAQRTARFLQRRGFSSDVIRRLLYEEQ
jgi:regulatory protein